MNMSPSLIELYRAEHEYMNTPPPPPINALAAAMTIIVANFFYSHKVLRFISKVQLS